MHSRYNFSLRPRVGKNCVRATKCSRGVARQWKNESALHFRVDPLEEQRKDSLVRKVFDLVRKRTFRGALYIYFSAWLRILCEIKRHWFEINYAPLCDSARAKIIPTLLWCAEEINGAERVNVDWCLHAEFVTIWTRQWQMQHATNFKSKSKGKYFVVY